MVRDESVEVILIFSSFEPSSKNLLEDRDTSQVGIQRSGKSVVVFMLLRKCNSILFVRYFIAIEKVFSVKYAQIFNLKKEYTSKDKHVLQFDEP